MRNALGFLWYVLRYFFYTISWEKVRSAGDSSRRYGQLRRAVKRNGSGLKPPLVETGNKEGWL